MIRAGDVLQGMTELPLAPLAAVTGAGPALILAPHPDDETLGCGGLIAAAAAAGRPPFVVVLTDGTGSHPNSRSHPPARLKAVREQETLEAMAILGLPPGQVAFLGLRDTAAPMEGDAFAEAVATVLSLARQAGAATILGPWEHDPHCDHLAAHRIAAAAASLCGARRLAYPIWGWTLPPDKMLPGLPGAPLAGFRLSTAGHHAAKQRAIAAHASQYGGLIRDDPTGFQLPAGLLGVFNRPYETFLEVD